YFAGLPKENREVVERIQTFAMGLRVEHASILDAAFQCPDERAAKALEQWLRQQKPKEIKETKISQKDNWVSFQAKVADISPLINTMKSANPPALSPRRPTPGDRGQGAGAKHQ